MPKSRFLRAGSIANVQGIGSLPTVRLGRKLGVLPSAAMDDVKRAIAWAPDFDRSTPAP